MMASEEETETPMQVQTKKSRQMRTKVIGEMCLLVWVISYKHFIDPVHGSVWKGCIYYEPTSHDTVTTSCTPSTSPSSASSTRP